MRVRSGVDAGGARGALDQLRALAASFADDAAVQTVLASAAYDAGDFDLSVAAADRALAADPRSVDAMIAKGRASVALAVRASSKDPAMWAAARRWFIVANKTDPLYFYPVQLFYESFRTAGQAPTPAARKALLYAYTLNPANVALRLEAARVLLEDGNAPAARIALDTAAIGEYGGALAPLAAKALRMLDTSGPAAAITVLETRPET
jgi:tetratricopeptide (TPR) repeat protein